MIAKTPLKEIYQNFARIAEPYLHIKDERHYEEALEMVETLISEVEDKTDEPLNGLIELLSGAIAVYEDNIKALKQFDGVAKKGPADISLLRLIMDQHHLGVNDFPEIGDKSLISRILSGKRNLTKQHIEKLSVRFNINPGLFFDTPYGLSSDLSS